MLFLYLLFFSSNEIIKSNNASSISKKRALIPCPNLYFSEKLNPYNKEKEAQFQNRCEVECSKNKFYFGIWFINERGKPEAACWNSFRHGERVGYNAQEQKCECGIHIKARSPPDRHCKPNMEISGIKSSKLCDEKCSDKMIHTYNSKAYRYYLGFCYVKGGYKYPNLFGKSSLTHYSDHQQLICHCAVEHLPENELSAIEQRRESFKPHDQYYFPGELRAIVDALRSGKSVDLSRLLSKISVSPRNSSTPIPGSSAGSIPWNLAGVNPGNLASTYPGKSVAAIPGGLTGATLASSSRHSPGKQAGSIPWNSAGVNPGNLASTYPGKSVAATPGGSTGVTLASSSIHSPGKSSSGIPQNLAGAASGSFPRSFPERSAGATSGNLHGTARKTSGSSCSSQGPSGASGVRLPESLVRAAIEAKLGDIRFNTSAHGVQPDNRRTPHAQASNFFGTQARANLGSSSNVLKPIPRRLGGADSSNPVSAMLSNLGSTRSPGSSRGHSDVSGRCPIRPDINNQGNRSPHGSPDLGRTNTNNSGPAVQNRGNVDTSLSLGGIFMRDSDTSPNPAMKKKQRGG